MRALRVAVAVAALAALPGVAGAQPDPSLMNGQALPAPELPDGTVTVRVFRGAVGNDAVGETVDLAVGVERRSAVTDAEGRAEFAGLIGGTQGTASATVDGESLVSAPFTVPARGGLRVILIAGVGPPPVEAAAAVPGVVRLGPNSRVIAQFQEDALQVFYLLEIVNADASPVDIGGPVLLELPRGAAGAAVMNANSPSATVTGELLTVVGPFQPGTTSVQVGYTMPHSRPDITIEQTWPVAVDGLTVGVERVAGVGAASAQFIQTGEITADDGTPYLLADVGPIPAGGVLTLSLTGLPVHSTLPRNIAVALALLVLGVGGWAAWRGTPESGTTRARLIARRDTLLGDLAKLEARRRDGRESERDAARRQRLLGELEQIYAELDQAGAGPRGGGEDVAA